MLEETAVTEETAVAVGMESEFTTMESQANSEGVAARLTVDMEETGPRPPGKTDSPSKRKG